jgi:hypothetical protein
MGIILKLILMKKLGMDSSGSGYVPIPGSCEP